MISVLPSLFMLDKSSCQAVASAGRRVSGKSSPQSTSGSFLEPPIPHRSNNRQQKMSHPIKESTIGDYILGQTLGEGEFGKVKLGWRKPDGRFKYSTDRALQVAIKLIRKESVDSQTRMQKVEREISVLRRVRHPNIVKLYDVIYTERCIGIILEYASGGELFDYILSNRYLRDSVASKLFAQLVSGVIYLHNKGVIHRDLKLENLLLDCNRNIIITDFGFANIYDPRTVSDEDDNIVPTVGYSDYMATSCGSPCYAAPELVITDSLYHGRKVDVWSCGVILYAMLAGYLPFDDDPANPDGDNINLLYKYIVHTPVTFPEYVTPLARDLLRRILVADPKKRITLQQITEHSWLAAYALVFKNSMHTHRRELSETFLASLAVGRSGSARDSVKRQIRHHYMSPIQTNVSSPHTLDDRKRHTMHVSFQRDSPQYHDTEASNISGSANASMPSTIALTSVRNAPIPGARATLATVDETSISDKKELQSSGGFKVPQYRSPMPHPKQRPTSYQIPLRSDTFFASELQPNDHHDSTSRHRNDSVTSVSSVSSRTNSMYGRRSCYIDRMSLAPVSSAAYADGEIVGPTLPANAILSATTFNSEKLRTDDSKAKKTEDSSSQSDSPAVDEITDRLHANVCVNPIKESEGTAVSNPQTSKIPVSSSRRRISLFTSSSSQEKKESEIESRRFTLLPNGIAYSVGRKDRRSSMQVESVAGKVASSGTARRLLDFFRKKPTPSVLPSVSRVK